MFIGAEIGMQQLDEKGEVDILKIVSTLRQDRGGMVQTKDQYLFLYQVSFVQTKSSEIFFFFFASYIITIFT